MLTTGFKTFAAWAVALVVAAIVFGYTTGGTSVGPVSLGWKGGVGNHVGYSILLFGGTALGVLAGLSVFFRDADSEAAADYLGVSQAPVGQRPTGPSLWPIVGAFGAGALAIGLAVSPILFVAGLVLLAAAAIEWTMSAWADAATGDPEVNQALRDRIMGPIEIPVLGFAAIGVVVLAVSRIFIAVSAEAAVWVAIGVAAVIFATAILFALKPQIPRNVVVAVCLLGGIGVLAGGVVAGVAGEREFHHGEEGEEHAEEGDEHEEGGADHSETDEAEATE